MIKEKIAFSVDSNNGLFRSNNEDNFCVNQYYNEKISKLYSMNTFDFNERVWNIAGVFDGMGGEENGEIASWLSSKQLSLCYDKFENDMKYEEICNIVKDAFLLANNDIVDERNRRPVCGTTGTVFITDGVIFKIFHAGDSRAYLLRDNELFQLTQDHTLAELKKTSGFYCDEKNIQEKEKHQLTEYIGRDSSMQCFEPEESEWIEFKDSDIILLCTDGLYDMCTDSEIRKILNEDCSCNEKNTRLIASALNCGGHDNITSIIISKG